MNDIARGWQYRAIERCRGQQTMLGAVLIAIMGQVPRRPPMFDVRGAYIDQDGNVFVGGTNRHGEYVSSCPLGTVSDLGREFNRLADDLKFTDAERLDMFEGLRKWIVRDYRAKSELS